MFLKLICFVSTITYFSSAALAEVNAELYGKLVSVLCAPDLPPDNAKLVKECEALVPKPVHDIWHACIRETFSVSTIDFAIFCYKTRPEHEKLQQCLDGREAELSAHGIVIDQKMKDQFRDKYMGCMVKAV